MELTEMEKNFLIDCIIMSINEGFYRNRTPITSEEIRDLMVRLDATEEDLEDYDNA